MVKQCPECERMLELNDCNYRRFNGSWRNTCRDCQNARKRKQYKLQKVNSVKKPNPDKTAREQRVQAMMAKYHKVLKTLDKLGVSPNEPAMYVDKVLENAANLSDRKSA